MTTRGYAYRHKNVAAPEPLLGREHSGQREARHAAGGSRMLREATQALFRRWERRHGFRAGAGELLLPRGYSVKGERE